MSYRLALEIGACVFCAWCALRITRQTTRIRAQRREIERLIEKITATYGR